MNPLNKKKMLRLNGLRVVRGPDWKWGDQDGGEGGVGTVFTDITYRYGMMDDLQPGTVFVIWDVNGIMDKYRCGYQGFYDLRVIDNTAGGVKHSNIPCDGANCSVKEICGTRWQCTMCDINLCTNCYLKEIPHHPDHNQYKRYDDSKIIYAPVVFGWHDDGPQSRFKLMGIYPGAKVTPGLQLDFPPLQQRPKTGLVLPNTDNPDALLGSICVEWNNGTKEHVKIRQCPSYQELSVEVKEPAVGGYYNSSAFPVLGTIPRGAKFYPDDLVQIRMEKLEGVQLLDENTGDVVDYCKIKGVSGRVKSVSDKDITVKFTDLIRRPYVRLIPAHVKKLNKFSMHETVRIKKDEKTIQEIKERFKSYNFPFKLEGEIGQVCEIASNNKLGVHFDNEAINKWFFDYRATKYYPASWMERVKSCVGKELAELASKTTSLFYKAVRKGDLRTVKLLISRHGVDVNASSFNGLTALHLAIIEGQKEIVKWILDQPQTDLEKRGRNSYYGAIHYAVLRSNPEILEMLIKKGAKLYIANRHYWMVLSINAKPPLELALSMKRLECCRLIIQHGCNVYPEGYYRRSLTRGDHFDYYGTPLHHAIFLGIAHDIIKLLVTKLLENQTIHPDQIGLKKLIDIKNRFGLTALLLACQKKDYVTIELLVEAGADVNTVSARGNTAIILAASSLDEDKIPSKELSPSIYKFWQNAKDGDKDLLEIYPILSLLGYLLKIGCCWETANKAGKKAADILLEKGYSNEAIELLNHTAALYKRRPFGPRGCMGLNGECALLPVFRFTCHHKLTFRTCSGCFPLIFEQHKCGCPEEGVASIKTTQQPQDPADLFARSVQNEAAAAVPPDEAQNRPEPEEMQPDPIGNTVQDALLMACKKKDYTTIEQLIEAGADLSTVDKEGNTAIILTVSSTEEDAVPSEEFSPSTYKLYQNVTDDAIKELMKTHPILPLLAYLLKIGCCWDSVNLAGKKAANILLEKGFPKAAIEYLDQTAALWKRWPIGAKGCMGQNGECALQAVYFCPSCSHQASLNACPQCYRLHTPKRLDCGCVAQFETDGSDHSANPAEDASEEIENRADVALKWIDDGTEKGRVEDRLGNWFLWNGRVRLLDGAIGYRCDKMLPGEQRCPAVARRFLNRTVDGIPWIELESAHKHPGGIKRNYDDGTRSGTAGPSGSSKRQRISTRRSCADEAV